MWDSSLSGTHGIPLDSPICPKWESGKGRKCGIQARVVHMGFHWTCSPICPTSDSWMGWSCGIQAQVVHVGFHWTVPSVPIGTVGPDRHVGFKRDWYMWYSIGQSHLSHMGQWDRMDTWDSSSSGTRGNALDIPICPKWDS